MEQTTPEAQVSQPQAAQAPVSQPQAAPAQPAAVPAKKTPVWVWILGGCLTIIILGFLVTATLGYLAAKKIKKEFRENAPKWEQMGKDAEEFQKEMEKVQKEIEKNQPQPQTVIE